VVGNKTTDDLNFGLMKKEDEKIIDAMAAINTV
jgi:hypothetical protein